MAKIIKKNAIDFLKKKNLEIFKNIPVFIYHGKKDNNCSFVKTKRVVNKLKQLDCNVTFKSEDTGHNFSEKIINNLYDWFYKQFK